MRGCFKVVLLYLCCIGLVKGKNNLTEFEGLMHPVIRALGFSLVGISSPEDADAQA